MTTPTNPQPEERDAATSAEILRIVETIKVVIEIQAGKLEQRYIGTKTVTDGIMRMISANYTSNDAVREAFNRLEAQGHGGGNWRRLIALTRADLGLDKQEGEL